MLREQVSKVCVITGTFFFQRREKCRVEETQRKELAAKRGKNGTLPGVRERDLYQFFHKVTLFHNSLTPGRDPDRVSRLFI